MLHKALPDRGIAQRPLSINRKAKVAELGRGGGADLKGEESGEDPT